MSFKDEVFAVVRAIKPGRVMTYKEVAFLAGRPKAWRAVGNILAGNRNYRAVPCHRVVCSDGRIGGYNRGTKQKILLLKKEGLKIISGRIIKRGKSF